MIWLRSTCCNLLMMVWTLLCGITLLPLLLWGERGSLIVMRVWGRGMLWLARAVCGIRLTIKGTVPTGAVLVASKHQSALETFAFYQMLSAPVTILKRELYLVPVIGWYIWGLRSIAINRKDGTKALKSVVKQSLQCFERGKQVVIYPEGTRVKCGGKRAYHAGVAAIYHAANVPVIPVALNTGKCWGKNSWRKYSGDVVIAFLEPIPQGLPRKEFMALLEARIEAGCGEL